MGKTIDDAPLKTREARKRLDPGLHWRSLDADVHLGYRKSKRAGVWLVRWRVGKGYRQEAIGSADDMIAVGTLDFRGAVNSARKLVEEKRTEQIIEAAGPTETIRSAMTTYVAMRDARDSRRAGSSVRSDASRKLERYVIGREKLGRRPCVAAAPIATVQLHKLTEKDLADWLGNLPTTMKRTGILRLIGDVKAALNSAYEKQRGILPATLPTIIKYGLKLPDVDPDESLSLARENQILTDTQIAAVLIATREVDNEFGWDGDLFRLLVVMTATGARFSQVVRLRVIDVQPEAGRLMMPPSRKGRGGKRSLIAVQVGQDVFEVLAPVMKGRDKSDFLLNRWRLEQRPGSIRWHRKSRGPWQTPSEIVRPWGEIRARVGLIDAVPYALRHSSIVRAIRANLPLRLIAAIHDTSVAMIERHYARYIIDGMDEIAARAVIPIVPKAAIVQTIATPI